MLGLAVGWTIIAAFGRQMPGKMRNISEELLGRTQRCKCRWISARHGESWQVRAARHPTEVQGKAKTIGPSESHQVWAQPARSESRRANGMRRAVSQHSKLVGDRIKCQLKAIGKHENDSMSRHGQAGHTFVVANVYTVRAVHLKIWAPLQQREASRKN